MTVKRIVANLASDRIEAATVFYRDILDLELLMDHGWIHTYGNSELMAVQISIASEGGAGTPVPDLSIEVDNLDEIYARVQAARMEIEYDIAEEAWGVRRFFCTRSFGALGEYFAAYITVNIHTGLSEKSSHLTTNHQT